MKRDNIKIIPVEELKKQQVFVEGFRFLPDPPKTYHIVTYGCQMNTHDSEKLAGMLEKMGLTHEPEKELADFVLSNTCCIRDNAERKAVGNVHWQREIKKKRPNMLIGICGCMMEETSVIEKVQKNMKFVDIAFGTGNIHQLPEILYNAVANKTRCIKPSAVQSTMIEGLPVTREDKYHAYVTIMYGCDNCCTFCIVPYVRGKERSRNAEDIVNDVRALVSDGVKEIMLLGQNVNSYGSDKTDNITFAKLLNMLEKTGIERIRFMTSHPKDLSDELIDEMKNNRALLPHFHLPVQSGSDHILSRMNRRYTKERFLERVESLRKAVPNIGLTTDFIVGFPGETEEDFLETLDLAEKAQFQSAFTFIYSPREGTPAARMQDQVPANIAGERLRRLIELQERMTEKEMQKMLGVTEKVLVTGHSRRDGNMVTGKGERGLAVNFPGGHHEVGTVVPVKIISIGKTTLRGERIKENHNV